MKNQIKSILYIVLFAVFILGAYGAYHVLSKEYKPENQLQASEPTAAPTAPDFTVYDGDGNQVHLSDFFGKPIVLNFWASWCPPCKGEMPHFNEVYNERKDDDIVFLMVDLTDGSRETVDTAKQYIKDQGYTLPVYFDKDLSAANAYAISSIPATYFIDQNGIIVANQIGGMDKETLITGIDSILK